MKKYIAEFIGTAVLVTFGCGTAMLVGTDSVNGVGYLLTALAFGLSIVATAYCIGNISGIGLTGTSVNPARSIGPAIVSAINGNSAPMGELWIFIIAPLIGGALAAFVYKFLERDQQEA